MDDQVALWYIIVAIVSFVAASSIFVWIIKVKLQTLNYNSLTDPQDIELSPMFARRHSSGGGEEDDEDEEGLSDLW